MFIMSWGCFCMVAIFKSTLSSSSTHMSSINLQAGGYNPHFVSLSTILGVIGIPIAFVGFLGVFDDKPGWIRTFFHYLQIRLACNLVVFVADVYTLSSCEGYAASPYDQKAMHINGAIQDLSERNMCHYGRVAYYIGFALSTLFEVYCLYYVWKYTAQLELNPPYAIDFGYEKYDTTSRWKFYEVAEPEEIPMFEGKAGYDATEKVDQFKDQYGPDGVKAKPTFAPDGMRGPSYIRAQQ